VDVTVGQTFLSVPVEEDASARNTGDFPFLICHFSFAIEDPAVLAFVDIPQVWPSH